MEQVNGHVRLNLGCGLQTPAGWINVDGSWNAALARIPVLRKVLAAVRLMPAEKNEIPWSSKVYIHDLRKPLPFKDGEAHAVFASHVLEHLYREEGQQLIRESFRVLCPGGVLRVIVPDLEAIIREYRGERPFGELSPAQQAMSPADLLNERLLMRWPSPGGQGLYRIYRSWQDFHTHKWMYDAASLSALFASVGFSDIQQKTSGESLIPDIATVEDPSRILNCAGVCVEGRKLEGKV
jgi:SAM-dependent methyltransferase